MEYEFCAPSYAKKSPFRYNVGAQARIITKKGDFNGLKGKLVITINEWGNTHIVFPPKYRRKIIYNQYKESVSNILKPSPHLALNGLRRWFHLTYPIDFVIYMKHGDRDVVLA